MGDSNTSKPGSPPAPGSPKPEAEDPVGHVVHDARGNAVWTWVKDTARIAIDSTSRLLKRLEVPELKLEDTSTNAPQPGREPDRDIGGGYDPYGNSNNSRSGPVSRSGLAADSAGRNAVPARRATPDPGGGYDPYGKGVTRKPGR
jgi:hypothetical protein